MYGVERYKVRPTRSELAPGDKVLNGIREIAPERGYKLDKNGRSSACNTWCAANPWVFWDEKGLWTTVFSASGVPGVSVAPGVAAWNEAISAKLADNARKSSSIHDPATGKFIAVNGGSLLGK